MYNRLKRALIGVQDPNKDVNNERQYRKYKPQTRGEYEELMMELEFRCRRAAMMYYVEASAYDKSIFRMEIIAAFLGTISMSAVIAWIVPRTFWSSSSFMESYSQLGPVGIIGLIIAFLVYFVGNGSSRFIPTLSRRADVNVAAAAAWQRLAQTTRSYRIQLDNPKLEVLDYGTWYERLLVERKDVCAMASIPQTSYEKFNNPDKIYKEFKRRRQMFQHILELERSELEDF